MDTEIRDALARSLPDLALIVRRDGIILSCVGGHAVRGLKATEEQIPGRAISDLWSESIATHVMQTVRRILKTRKPAQQRYQEGDIKLEMRFQVQGFDRVLVVCRDLGAGATSNDSGLYPKSGSLSEKGDSPSSPVETFAASVNNIWLLKSVHVPGQITGLPD